MQSLAEDNTHFAIGIILSGSDSDGIIGMEHIKSTGGITYAQNQQTSKFFIMPKKSIDSGVVDFVLSPEAIAKELNRISYNEHIKHDLIDKTGGKLDEHLGEILSLIHARKNIDFRHYKPATLRRRILRRIVMNNIKNVTGYVEYLKKNPVEIDALSSDILIKVTKFFRDPEMYKALKKDVFPKIFTGGRNKKPVRFWVTACSTGQETYSMAISIAEFLGQKMSGYNIQIFSTDLNEAGIEKARTGIYSGEIKDDVSEQRLKKFFRKSGSNYIINKNIRKLCVFAKQNFINDPPFSKIDLISCRNVLIYMSTELQKKVIPVFHYALKDGCYLVLGYSESIGKWAHMFDVTDRKNKIYSKKQITFKTGHEYLRKELLNLEPAKLTGGPANVSSVNFRMMLNI
ncbi:MAG: hypothetical protein IPL53_10380 [Ignavibacteria bacterium]|nr:hypothetical protein [Ignavibacteria bacterium]